MIIKKYWHRFDRFRNRRNYMGIFLFGFIPLYIICSDKC